MKIRLNAELIAGQAATLIKKNFFEKHMQAIW